MDTYRYDLHCHTHEGSPDSKVSMENYIRLLIEQGFSGMLVTDHDSYRGYEHYRKHLQEKYPDFTVLKGIEYDTFDVGHFLVILPSGFDSSLLSQKGMTIRHLIDYVHENGGILGPAHPFTEPFLAIYRTGKYKRDPSITGEFDFLEGFNSCEFPEDNARACQLADQYDKPVTGGSDSHWEASVGTAYTEFTEPLRTEDDLIAYIKAGKPTVAGGIRYPHTTRDKLGPWNKLLVWSFYPYNKFGALVHFLPRLLLRKKAEKEAAKLN